MNDVRLTGAGSWLWMTLRFAGTKAKARLDEIPENEEWTYAQIMEAYYAVPYTICQTAEQFVTGGAEAALERKEQVGRHKKIDGRLIERRSILSKPRHPERQDCEYRAAEQWIYLWHLNHWPAKEW